MTVRASSRSSPAWAVRLFGRFEAKAGNAELEAVPGGRTRELLAYLLVFRERPHHREVLAATLWPESSTGQARKYLRQSLWHLRGLESRACGRLLCGDSDWVQADGGVWLDVAELEEAFGLVKLVAGERIDAEAAEALKAVVPLYRGNLLEGCFQDWCVYERERLKAMYISLLEKLLGYCETHGEPEEGLVYGEKLLRHDRAHERAHWRLMRLHYLLGNRTGALRQFQRCREALEEELGVAPGQRVRVLYEQIRVDGDIASTSPVRSTSAFALGAANVSAPAGLGPGSLGPGQPGDHPGVRRHCETMALQRALEALRVAEKVVEHSIRAAQQ